MRLAVVAAGFTPGEADQLRRAMGAWRRPGMIDQFRRKLIDGMRGRGLQRGICRSGVRADPRLRRIWLSRIARRQLRPAGLCLGLAEMPLSGRLRRGPAQQPADGLLCPGPTGPQRPRARRRSPAGRRDGQPLGLHARAQRARPGPVGPALGLALDLGIFGNARPGDRRGPAAGPLPLARRFRAANPAGPGGAAPAGRGRRAGLAGSRSARRPVERAGPRRPARKSAALGRPAAGIRRPRPPAAAGAARTGAGRLSNHRAVAAGPSGQLSARRARAALASCRPRAWRRSTTECPCGWPDWCWSASARPRPTASPSSRWKTKPAWPT